MTTAAARAVPRPTPSPARPRRAFFVRCDDALNPTWSQGLGRLVAEIGVAQRDTRVHRAADLPGHRRRSRGRGLSRDRSHPDLPVPDPADPQRPGATLHTHRSSLLRDRPTNLPTAQPPGGRQAPRVAGASNPSQGSVRPAGQRRLQVQWARPGGGAARPHRGGPQRRADPAGGPGQAGAGGAQARHVPQLRGLAHRSARKVHVDLWAWLQGMPRGRRAAPATTAPSRSRHPATLRAGSSRPLDLRARAALQGDRAWLSAKTGEIALEELPIHHEGLRLGIMLRA